MSVINPRNRLVNFRLSEDEFERLRQACGTFGARSISDFARGSVLDRISEGPAQETRPQERIAELGTKVTALEGRVSQLLNLLDATGKTVATYRSATPESLSPEGSTVLERTAEPVLASV